MTSMIVLTHHIAGITFRTETNAPLRRLQEGVYQRFRVGDDPVSDVRQRIHRVDEGELTLPTPSAAAVQGAHQAPGALEGPILRAPAVRERVRTVLADGPASANVWLYPDRAMVYDFGQCALDLFYLDAYGHTHEDLAPEERLHSSGDGPDERFRIHQVAVDSLTLPPLTAEELERLARIVEFLPELIPDIPLFRSPAVRAALRPGLEGTAQMRVYRYLDGIMIWNRLRDVVDFFYPEGGGRFVITAEDRVSSNLRQIFATFLTQFSALQVHCAGVILDDRAALFLAPDGGGKTTALGLAPGGLLLNDDQVIVRREGEDWIAHGTPFGTMTDGPNQAQLGGLFVLEKAARFELLPLRPASLVETYWKEHLNYTFFLPRRLKLRAFDLVCEVCQQVPVYRMRFPKDHVDWGAVDTAMAAGR